MFRRNFIDHLLLITFFILAPQIAYSDYIFEPFEINFNVSMPNGDESILLPQISRYYYPYFSSIGGFSSKHSSKSSPFKDYNISFDNEGYIKHFSVVYAKNARSIKYDFQYNRSKEKNVVTENRIVVRNGDTSKYQLICFYGIKGKIDSAVKTSSQNTNDSYTSRYYCTYDIKGRLQFSIEVYNSKIDTIELRTYPNYLNDNFYITKYEKEHKSISEKHYRDWKRKIDCDYYERGHTHIYKTTSQSKNGLTYNFECYRKSNKRIEKIYLIENIWDGYPQDITLGKCVFYNKSKRLQYSMHLNGKIVYDLALK